LPSLSHERLSIGRGGITQSDKTPPSEFSGRLRVFPCSLIMFPPQGEETVLSHLRWLPPLLPLPSFTSREDSFVFLPPLDLHFPLSSQRYDPLEGHDGLPLRESDSSLPPILRNPLVRLPPPHPPSEPVAFLFPSKNRTCASFRCG